MRLQASLADEQFQGGRMSKKTGIRLAILVAVPVAALAGCDRQVEERAETERPGTEFGTTATSPTTTAQRTDMELTTAVQAQLYAEDTLRGEDVDVRVANGVATLSGTVRTEAAEQQALTAVRGVEGITRVEDQITVEQAQQAEARRDTDARGTAGVDTAAPGWIATKIQAQYFVDPDVKPWNVDVTTTAGGIVELRGEVDSEQAKAEAVRIAKATEGVTRVEDHLRVRSAAGDRDAANRPAETGAPVETEAANTQAGEAWTTAKIQSKYFLDTDVKGRDIDVTTQNGTVTLRGTVESERERRQAVAIARNTDGVREVNDQLQVRAGGQAAGAQPREGDRARGTTGNVVAGIDDAWITTKVQSQYFLDTDVKGHEIDVDTRNGVVTLTGSVRSDAAKRMAESIARDAEGVSRVVNRLTVSPEGNRE
jgi:osmotically-inducible protein OsmY